MKDVIAMVLAGGRVDELGVLTQIRSKSALPFGGIHRIIDFPLTNLMESDIEKVGILSQYRPYSLMNHVGIGIPWDYTGKRRDLKFLPPYEGEGDFDWYRGTADAIYQNIHFIERYNPKYVLIISGDHIYRMNYHSVISFHKKMKADLTIVLKAMEIKGPTRFGIAEIRKDGRIVNYEEKPQEPKSNLVSLTIYVFNKEILIEKVKENAATGKNFQIYSEIIPSMVMSHRVFGYIFDGAWEYAREIESYHRAHINLLSQQRSGGVKIAAVRTNLEAQGIVYAPSPFFGNNADVKQSLISPGCFIDGSVSKSIISPWVRVGKNSKVINSIIFHNVKIENDCYIKDVIIDKNVFIGKGSKIGGGGGGGITVIGKNVCISDGSEIEKGSMIQPKV